MGNADRAQGLGHRLRKSQAQTLPRRTAWSNPVAAISSPYEPVITRRLASRFYEAVAVSL